MVRFGSVALVALFVFASSAASAQSRPTNKVVAQKKGPKKKGSSPAGTPAAATPAAAPTPAPPPPPPDPEPAPPATPAPSTPKDTPAAAPPSEEEPAKPISVAPLLGYATSKLNLGIGLRAGYTLSNRIYVGGTFVYHLGTSEESEGLGGKTEASVHVFYPGAEVGYDLPVGPVILRPYGGIGAAILSTSMKANGQEQSDSATSLALWPGCAVSYTIPRTPAFVGADARLLIITRADDPSFGMFATGGMRF